MSYVEVRKTLEKYGVKGTTFQQLQTDTELPSKELYQIIRHGFKIGGIESWQQNGTTVYRNRLRREKLYGPREWSILQRNN